MSNNTGQNKKSSLLMIHTEHEAGVNDACEKTVQDLIDSMLELKVWLPDLQTILTRMMTYSMHSMLSNGESDDANKVNDVILFSSVVGEFLGVLQTMKLHMEISPEIKINSKYSTLSHGNENCVRTE